MNRREAWLRAEASPHIPDDLPPKLQWLLLALRAVDEGQISAITDLRQQAQAAQQPDIAALLSILCDQIPDPPAEGHLAELLAILSARKSKLPEPIPSASLTEAADTRPALKATLKTLSAVEGVSGPLTKDAILTHALPRAEQVRVAATLLIQHGTINPETLTKAFGQALIDFSPGRWPDLHPTPTTLIAWAADTRPWTPQQQLALKRLVRADDTTRRDCLAALLNRVARDLAKGHVAGLQDPIWAAEGLASSLSLDPLSEQLYTLRLRLQWVEDDAPSELLAALWVQDKTLTPDERLLLGRVLMQTPPENVPQGVIVGCQLYVLAQTPDDAEAAAMLDMGAAQAQRSVLSQGLARMGASASRVAFLLGLHAATNGDLPFALSNVVALAERDQGDAAGMVLLRLLSRLPQKPLTPELLPHITKALNALADRAELRLSLDHWPMLLVHLKPLLGEIPDALSPLIERSLGGFPPHVSPNAHLYAARLLMLWLLAPSDTVRDWLREIGRVLRDLQPESKADDLALQTIAWMLFWTDHVEREALSALLMPLTRFVMRAGPAAAAAAAARCAAAGEPQLRGCIQWYFWNRAALGDDPRWVDLCCKVVLVPDAFAQAGANMVRAALAEGPESLFVFRAKIHDQIGKLIHASMAQR